VAVRPDLVSTVEERAEARAAVLVQAALPTIDPGTIDYLTEVLTALTNLVSTENDRAEARAAVLAALPTANPMKVGDLVAVLPGLVSTDADRDEARAGVLAALPTANPGKVGDLVAVLTGLNPNEKDRDGARTAVLAALPTATDPWDVRHLVAALRSTSQLSSWLAWLSDK
jgi:hypothetical protein